MRFDLVRPCSNCPFRRRAFILRRGRIEEILAAILDQDLTFTCHKTVDYESWDDEGTYEGSDRDQHCAGALILHELEGRRNWRIRLAHGLGLYDPDRLDMASDVYASRAEMLADTHWE